MNFRVLDNPAVCRRCGTTSQVMLFDGICGGCLTCKDVRTWLSTLEIDAPARELPSDADELKKTLRSEAALAEVDGQALMMAGAEAVGRSEWVEANLQKISRDRELCRLLERAGSGDEKSGRQAQRRISIYQVMWSGEAPALVNQLRPPRDAREEALFKLAGPRSKDSVRNDAISKILAGRKLDISFG